MNTPISTARFDERAKMWDTDPMKTARAQAVADAILAAVGATAGMRSFEYGCGTGLLSFCLQVTCPGIFGPVET